MQGNIKDTDKKLAKDNLVLSIDYGTQSVRALIFNQYGVMLCKKKIEFTPYFSIKAGWAEQNLDFYWDALSRATSELKTEYPELFNNIVALSITTFRDSYLCIDREGKPLRPLILWLDQRLAECDNKLPQSRVILYKLVKMYDVVIAQMKASHSNWIKENEPDVWNSTFKYISFSGYLTYKFTNNIIDSVANQIGHIPFNSKKRRWMTEKDLNYYVWDIPRDKLVDLVEPGEALGVVTREASLKTGIPEGIKVIACGSDKGCETIGTGCNKPDMASISFGTAATIQMTLKEYVEPITFMPAYPAVEKNLYNSEIQVYRGYWMISWFKKEFAAKEVAMSEKLGISAEELLNQRLSEIPVGSDGLILQPYWGPTLKAPEGKGAIIGFSDVHTRAHIYRAIIEGIGFALLDGLKNMEKNSGYTVKMLTVSGGGAQSDVICQITADMFGVPVARAQTYETSGLGAAMIAYVGIGAYKSIKEATDNMVTHTKIFKPDIKNHKFYDKLYRDVYRKMYKHIQPLYNEIKEIYSNYYDSNLIIE